MVSCDYEFDAVGVLDLLVSIPLRGNGVLRLRGREFMQPITCFNPLAGKWCLATSASRTKIVESRIRKQSPNREMVTTTSKSIGKPPSTYWCFNPLAGKWCLATCVAVVCR